MYHLRTRGRFVSRKKYALDALKAVGRTNWMRIIFLIIFFSIYLIGTEPHPIEYAQAEGVATNEENVATTTPIIIELTYTEERIKEKILEAFPDAPIMLKVAACESGFVPHAYNPTNGSHDGGIFQISEKYHGDRLEALGLDRFNVEDNLKYARILYNESGLQPWSASKHCWSK